MGGMGGAMQGDVPESCIQKIQYIKYCVIVCFVSSIVSLVMGGSASLFSAVMFCIAAIFLIKEDKVTGPAYRCLMQSPLGQCAGPTGGGLSCLMPTMVLGGMNVVFGMIGGGFAEPFGLISLLSQLAGAVFAYQIFSYLRGEAGPTGQLPGQSYSPPEAREMQSTAPTGQPPAPQTNFIAFQGEGNKLGNN